jgi:hypothetical protein
MEPSQNWLRVSLFDRAGKSLFVALGSAGLVWFARMMMQRPRAPELAPPPGIDLLGQLYARSAINRDDYLQKRSFGRVARDPPPAARLSARRGLARS